MDARWISNNPGQCKHEKYVNQTVLCILNIKYYSVLKICVAVSCQIKSKNWVMLHIRGHYQIDVKCINRHVTAGLCFEYLGSYESSEHALSNEVW